MFLTTCLVRYYNNLTSVKIYFIPRISLTLASNMIFKALQMDAIQRHYMAWKRVYITELQVLKWGYEKA